MGALLVGTPLLVQVVLPAGAAPLASSSAVTIQGTSGSTSAAPANPTSVSAVQSSNSGAVIVSWFPAPNSTGNAIGVYSGSKYVGGGKCYGTCSSYVVTGLAPGAYQFVVWAQNATGTSSGVATPSVAVSAQPPSAPASVVVDDVHTLGPVNRNLFGTDVQLWEKTQAVNNSTRQLWPSVTAAASTLGLHMIRMNPDVNLEPCGGTDCTYHWTWATPGAAPKANIRAYQLSPDEWMQQVAAIAPGGAVPMIQANIEAGTVSEAQDFVAYMNGATSSVQPLSDGTTVGHWAQLRASNGHSAPYAVHYWEMGNEETALRDCTSSANGSHCVNQPPPPCKLLTNQAMYACLINAYGTAMKAVDPSIGIVASFDGSDYSQVHSAASSVIEAFDVHQYADAPIDPYGTTFDTDGQSADYPVSYTTTVSSQPVSFGVWLAASSSAHVDVYLDHSSSPVASLAVAATLEYPYVVTRTEATAGTYSHTLSVVACDSASVTPATNRCAAAGRHPAVYLRHLTVTLGNTSSAQLAGTMGCFNGVQGLQATTLVDTRVSTTSGSTGTAGTPGAPWRLGSTSDFPVAFASGSAAIFGTGTPNQFSKLQYWRNQLTSAGFTSTPIIVGEYGAWGRCSEQPANLSVTQSSAIWSSLITQMIYADQGTAQPIIGAAQFAFSGGAQPSCFAWTLVTTKMTSNNPCQGGDTAYDGAAGAAYAQFASLSGVRAAALVAGGPAVVSLPASSQPIVNAPGVSAVASTGGGVTTVVLVNACPPTSTQCGEGSVPVTVKLASGVSAKSVSASAVGGAPFDVNSDAAKTTVQQVPLAASISGGSMSVTLPPFSVTRITINT